MNFKTRDRVYRAISLILRMGVFTVMLGTPIDSSAVLGGDVASVQADQIDMKASQKIIHVNSYTVYEIQSPSGAMLREYVSHEGAVFAVSWRGPSLPDLRQLLGSYFDQYIKAAQVQHSSHGSIIIRTPELAVESSGHMRAFRGRAYLPQLIPQDALVTDIQ